MAARKTSDLDWRTSSAQARVRQSGTLGWHCVLSGREQKLALCQDKSHEAGLEHARHTFPLGDAVERRVSGKSLGP